MTHKIYCIKFLSQQHEDVLPTVEAEVASHYHNALRFFPKRKSPLTNCKFYCNDCSSSYRSFSKMAPDLSFLYMCIEILLVRSVLITNLFSIFYTTVTLGWGSNYDAHKIILNQPQKLLDKVYNNSNFIPVLFTL